MARIIKFRLGAEEAADGITVFAILIIIVGGAIYAETTISKIEIVGSVRRM